MKRKKPDEAAIANRRLISEARAKFYRATADGVPTEEAAADASKFYRDALSSGAGLAAEVEPTILKRGEPVFTASQMAQLTDARVREIVRDEVQMPAPGKMPAPPNMAEPHRYDAVQIPADLNAFRALTWPQRKSIASKISETPIKDIASAEAAYVAEMERRAL
jgi:hypothetical protein